MFPNGFHGSNATLYYTNDVGCKTTLCYTNDVGCNSALFILYAILYLD